jgi:phage terminase large subunit
MTERIHIHPKFAPMFAGVEKRYIIITGGRGSMKSFTIALWACLNTFNPGQRVLYTRYTLSSAEISVIPEFLDKIDLINSAELFNIRKTRIENTKTGSDILFSGIKTSAGNQTAKLKSIPNLNVLIVDEAEEFTSERDFDSIDESIRSMNGRNYVILVMNPPSTEHWIYKRFFEGYERYEETDGARITMTTNPAVHHIHTTYLENECNLSASFLEIAAGTKASHPAKYAHRYIGAWRDKVEGVIYERWKEGLFDDSIPSVYGFDEGFSPDPAAMVQVAVDHKRKRLYVRECFYEARLSTNAVIERIGAHCKRNDMIVADDKGRLLAEIERAGFNIRKAHKYPGSVKDGIRKIHDYEIIVSPGSHNVAQELRNYAWHDRRSDTPADGNDHALDAMRYAFMALAGRQNKSGIKRRN